MKSRYAKKRSSMMSHIGSLSRSGRSPGEDGGSAASGAVRSAILTYFDWIVITPPAGDDRIVPQGPPPTLRRPRKRALMGVEPYRVLARDAKALQDFGTTPTGFARRKRHGGETLRPA